MEVDWDGRVRRILRSPYAMHSLIGPRISSTWHSRPTGPRPHGVVAKSVGLLPPNTILTACIITVSNRPDWSAAAAVGKTVVSSSAIDCVAGKLGRKLYEVPVGFKWFVDGLLERLAGFRWEESAGASFFGRNGAVWTTDKDGIIGGRFSPRKCATRTDTGSRRDLCGSQPRMGDPSMSG